MATRPSDAGESWTAWTGRRKAGASVAGSSRNASEAVYSLVRGFEDASMAGGDLSLIVRYAGNNFAQFAQQVGYVAREAKSAGTSLLSTLGAALKGPGGIIAGVSILITLLPTMISWLRREKEGHEEAAEAAKKHREAVDDLISSLRTATGAKAAQSIVEAQTLADEADRRVDEIEGRLDFLRQRLLDARPGDVAAGYDSAADERRDRMREIGELTREYNAAVRESTRLQTEAASTLARNNENLETNLYLLQRERDQLVEQGKDASHVTRQIEALRERMDRLAGTNGSASRVAAQAASDAREVATAYGEAADEMAKLKERLRDLRSDPAALEGAREELEILRRQVEAEEDAANAVARINALRTMAESGLADELATLEAETAEVERQARVLREIYRLRALMARGEMDRVEGRGKDTSQRGQYADARAQRAQNAAELEELQGRISGDLIDVPSIDLQIHAVEDSFTQAVVRMSAGFQRFAQSIPQEFSWAAADVGSIFGSLASIVGSQIDAAGEEGIETQRALFEKQKSLRKAGIVADTAAGVANALATGGPFPLNLLSAAAVLAQGVAAYKAVDAERLPGTSSASRIGGGLAASTGRPTWPPGSPSATAELGRLGARSGQAIAPVVNNSFTPQIVVESDVYLDGQKLTRGIDGIRAGNVRRRGPHGPVTMEPPRLLIGIDPGTTTGLATVTRTGDVVAVESYAPLQAVRHIEALAREGSLVGAYVEDARGLPIYARHGRANRGQRDRIARGVGAVDLLTGPVPRPPGDALCARPMR